MNLNQLKKIFCYLPDSFIEEMQDKEFKTCWYSSSALDKRPMELLDYSHPDALTDEKVDVFFYTDIDFFSADKIFYYHINECKFNIGFWEEREIKRGEIINIFTIESDKNCKITISSDTLNRIEMCYDWKSIKIKDFIKKDSEYQMDLKKTIAKYKKDKIKETNKAKKNWDKFGDKELIDLFFQNTSSNNTIDVNEELKIEHRLYKEHFKKKYNNQSVCLVRHKRINNTYFYTFYIECDDFSFEQILLHQKINIDYVAHQDGHCVGPGPQFIGNLGCRFFLGNYKGINSLQVPLIGQKNETFEIKKLQEFVWHSEEYKQPFYEIKIK